MGEYAVDQFARDTGMSWADANDALYGDGVSGMFRRRCPICGKKCSNAQSVLRHCDAKHPKPEHKTRIAAWASRAITKEPKT